MRINKTLAVTTAAVALFFAGLLIGQKTFSAPTTLVHVVTVRWKKDATPEQKQAALDGVKKMAAAYPGIKNVWTKTVKVQSASNDFESVFAMEFASQKAFDDYVKDPAHVEWKKLYDPIHDESITHDVTN